MALDCGGMNTAPITMDTRLLADSIELFGLADVPFGRAGAASRFRDLDFAPID